MANLAENRTAFFDYDILETYEAGLVLTGQEVKSVKQGHLNLKGAYVTFHNGEATLLNAHISPYKQAGHLPDFDPTMTRHLLLHKREIANLQGKAAEKGLTIVPLKVYTKGRLIKVSIGVARGRHQYDKREMLKDRAIAREARQTAKRLNS